MTTLLIKDLALNKELDRNSMAAIHGGNGMGSVPATPTTPSTVPSGGNSSSQASSAPGWAPIAFPTPPAQNNLPDNGLIQIPINIPINLCGNTISLPHLSVSAGNVSLRR